jgi:hypothetical protein
LLFALPTLHRLRHSPSLLIRLSPPLFSPTLSSPLLPPSSLLLAPLRYIAVMLRRMLMAVMDPSFVDDRDYYGNKRLELAGVWRGGCEMREGWRVAEGLRETNREYLRACESARARERSEECALA